VSPEAIRADTFESWFDAIASNIAYTVHGKRSCIELSLMTMLAGGHLLIEDVPGVGKTSLAKALAGSVECSWTRVQFTPDLLPSDLTGVSVFEQATGGFRFVAGPLFSNLVLADEINRASPKTQSALLEAMEERQITVDGNTMQLGPPFMVIATQNPLDHEGTFRLPESQMDRFSMRISLGYPNRAAEMAILQMHDASPHHDDSAKRSRPVVSLEQLLLMIERVGSVFIADAIKGYLVDLATKSRHSPDVRLGWSPRAMLQLAAAARACAASRRRDYVIPDDIVELAVPVLAHRLVMHSGRGHVSAAQATEEIVSGVAVPMGR